VKSSSRSLYYSFRDVDRPRIPKSLKVYARSMKCISCGGIPIPPIFTCTAGHMFCRPCGRVTPECVYEYDGDDKCRRLTRHTVNFLYEETFKTAKFSCPYKKYGCQDVFTGLQLKQSAFRDCTFKPKRNNSSIQDDGEIVME
jgi:hypothetical protein